MQLLPSKESWKILRDLLLHVDAIAVKLGFELDYQILVKGTKVTDLEKDLQASIDIEVLPGESMIDAITRVTKQRVAEGHSLGDTEVAEPKKRKKAAPKDTAASRGGDPNVGAEPAPDIYRAVHVYQRAGETDQKVYSNAKRERDMTGPSTLVFAHLHPFGGDCSSACRARVGGD